MTEELILKIGIALGSILIAQALIPIFKEIYHRWRRKQLFKRYLAAHVGKTLANFGSEEPIDVVQKTHGIGEPDWLLRLKKAGRGVPPSIIAGHLAIELTLSETGHDQQYIPYLFYLDAADIPLQHDSQLWELSGKTASCAMNYLLTQQQIMSAIKAQYSGFFFELIKSQQREERERWCKGAKFILNDMTEHYLDALALDAQVRHYRN
ncbi:hypothetical protein [Marinibactrum halimedae]|uniref:Uncharacterized protein n=1 Tax=Marinibactrum halimedae TaxID=1444977 RepID=A0AA37T6V0_9GAMM|nr:hypothetical protein [Marinibactrum halimedae]MCD9460976.1 hypothetical protein [Marinibactrum halimedae]GLS28080.1 hypothetical protein GCM10007877_37990 [Marinibactrum halimedae]